MTGKLPAREGVAYGHPRVTVATRPYGVAVLHDLRGPEEEIRRIRLVILAVAVGGLALLIAYLEHLRRLEAINPTTPFQCGFVALLILVVAAMALRTDPGWEEISLTAGQLHVRYRPGIRGDPAVILDVAQISRLQVEKDPLRYGAKWWRVQFYGPDGQGLLPADGPLTGIPSYPEALALSFAIAHHFDLTAVPGVYQHLGLPAKSFTGSTTDGT